MANLRPADFESYEQEMAKTQGPVSLGNDITRMRVMFKYAFDAESIDKPVKYGQGLRSPVGPHSASIGRKGVGGCSKPMRYGGTIEEAGIQLRAMVYLGINCGLGNNDSPCCR